MMTNIGVKCEMNMKIIRAKTDQEKKLIEEIIKSGQYDKLQPYIIQESAWIEW